jgi:pimeloyl-ACP methyl ester carboxylesterase
MLVGHSLGCGEIVRYLSRHGNARVSGAAFVGPQLPLLIKTADNPDGVEEGMLDAMLAQLEADVRQWCIDNAPPFFGANQALLPQAELIEIPGAAHGHYVTHADAICGVLAAFATAKTPQIPRSATASASSSRSSSI